MSDTDNNTEPDAEATETEPEADQPNPEPETDEEPWDKARGMATINKLRDEIRDLKAAKKRSSDLEKKLRELEDANKTEEQRRVERLAELEAAETARTGELRNLKLRLAVYQKAGELGITDPDLAVAALNNADVAFDENGDPGNLDDVLAGLVDKHPALKGGGTAKKAAAAATDAGAGNTPKKGPALTGEELQAAADLGMSPERYAAFKDAKTLDDYQRIRAEAKSSG